MKKATAAPKPVEAAPAPAPAPAPVVKQEAKSAVVPAAPAVAPAPVQPVEEKGFLENYWPWLLIIIIAIAGLWWFLTRQKKA